MAFFYFTKRIKYGILIIIVIFYTKISEEFCK